MINSKPKKLQFINEIPGVAELMPIVPATQINRGWVQRGLAQFAEDRKNPNWKNNRYLHVVRCPGMFALHRYGWILRTWQDIVIKTNGDGHSFEWRSASNLGGDAMGFHPPEQLSNLFEEWAPNTLRTVLKFHTGWHCIVPEGFYLYEVPLQFSEDYRFTTVSGFYSKETGPASMNVQVLWHVLNDEVLIKAGTPIAQYFLVPKEQPEIICRDADYKKDKLQLQKLYDSSKFVTNFGELKKLFCD